MTRRLLFALALLGYAPQAIAQTPAVDSARVAGIVGERFDGYLGIASDVPAMVRSQVGSINIRRRALYGNLATSRGASPSEVGIAAGCELLGRVEASQVYMLADGKWRRRGLGQPAPVPTYCG
ncbi:MAG: YdbL family protein [Sphingomicrobium sp.]